MWEARTGSVLHVFSAAGIIRGVAWSPDGRYLAGVGEKVQVWEVQSETLLHTLDMKSTSLTANVAWSPDGKRLAVAGIWKIQTWEIQTGKVLHWYTCQNSSSSSHRVIGRLAWSPDGKYLAVGTTKATLVWKINAEDAPPVLLEIDDKGRSIAWSPDGRYLAIATYTAVHICEIQIKKVIYTLLGNTSEWIQTMMWSPNGRYIAAGGADHLIKVWEAKTGRILRTFPGYLEPGNSISTVIWSPDSQKNRFCKSRSPCVESS